MQQIGLHQKKIIALIEALFAFIALLLPWTKYNVQGFNMFGGGGVSIPSENGFRSWGWLVIIGVVAVIICSLLENRIRDYSTNMKMAVMGGFGLIALGAIIYLIRLNTVGPLQTQDGMPVSVSAGIGLWLALAAGVIGLAWVSGLMNKFSQGASPTTSSSSAPPPPPPPPPPTA